jgi:hypothetical protein
LTIVTDIAILSIDSDERQDETRTEGDATMKIGTKVEVKVDGERVFGIIRGVRHGRWVAVETVYGVLSFDWTDRTLKSLGN